MKKINKPEKKSKLFMVIILDLLSKFQNYMEENQILSKGFASAKTIFAWSKTKNQIIFTGNKIL